MSGAKQDPPTVALKRGVNLLIPVIRAIGRGEWKPTPAATLLLVALSDELRRTP